MLQVSIQVLPSTPAGQLKLQGSRWTLVKAQHRLPFQQRPSLGDLGIGGRVWVWGTQSQDSGRNFLVFCYPLFFWNFLFGWRIYIMVYDWISKQQTKLTLYQFSMFFLIICLYNLYANMAGLNTYHFGVLRWRLIVDPVLVVDGCMSSHWLRRLRIIMPKRRMHSWSCWLYWFVDPCHPMISCVYRHWRFTRDDWIERMWFWWLVSGKGVNSAKDGCFVLLDWWEKKLQVGKDMVLKGKAGKERKNLIWY